MFTIRATQKVLNASGKIQLGEVEEKEYGELEEWFVNRIPGGERGKFAMVFMHVPSLMVVVTKHKSLAKAIPDFKSRLREFLEIQGFKKEIIEKLDIPNSEVVITKTNSKKFLGHLNDSVNSVRALMDQYPNFDAIGWKRVERNIFLRPNYFGKELLSSFDYWWNKNALDKADGVPFDIEMTQDEDLEMENAIMRLNLEAQQNATIGRYGNIDPKVENEFLKNMMAFEKAMENPTMVSIKNLLENKTFLPSNKIESQQLESHFENLLEELGTINVAIDFLGEYDTKTKYDFILNELFNQEIEKEMISGWVSCFIYEEFHPNVEMDVANRIEEFMNYLKKGESMEKLMWFAKETIMVNNVKCDADQLLELYQSMCEDFIWPADFEYKVVEVQHEKDDIIAYALVELYNDKGHTRLVTFKLEGEYNWWEILELKV
ncbi:MAG: hypothetical protein KDC92_00390 [Bacteroidetes bacterium]|nr:hypothetical protein [Bacteroidota bacterium]